MRIGVPREIKDHEYRVGATPLTARQLVKAGHQLKVETQAGAKIGFSDEDYRSAGAIIVPSAEEVYQAELIAKVKEPQPEEYKYLRENQILFCYLHLAAEPALTERLLQSKCIAIACETLTDAKGALPLLRPMSEIAGKISIQVGANALQMASGGKGVLLGGIAGVLPGKIVVVGGGSAGTEAIRIGLGMGAEVTVLDIHIDRLRALNAQFSSRLKTLLSNSDNLSESIRNADLVIGTVLIPGKKAPKILTRPMIHSMSSGSVLVDVSIDQGGCAETSKPTTHSHPTYIEEGVVHYCVTNMPGACAKTSTQAFTNATLDYLLQIANKGLRKALEENPGMQNGLNIYRGFVTNESVAVDLGYPFHFPDPLLESV